MGVQHPVGNVDQVRGLLDNVIAGQPQKHTPVPNLILQLTHPIRLELPRSATTLDVVVGPHVGDIADGTVANPLDAVQVVPLMAVLQTDDNREFLQLRLRVGRHECAVPGSVNAAGLFHEHMLAGLDRRGVVNRPKMWRRSQEDHIDASGEHLLVGVEAGKLSLLRHVDVRREIVVLLQILQAEFNPLGK